MYKLDIKIPIYGCTCKIIISKDIEKVINKYAKKKKWDKDAYIKDGAQVHGYAVSNENLTEYYVFYSSESATVNYLIHEISHLVDYILGERDIEDKGEAKAYLIGYISEKVFDFVFKKSLLINKWYKPQIENQKITDEKPRLLREGDQNPQRSEQRVSEDGDK